MNFLFVGDVMLGRLVNRFLKTAPSEYPWGNTLKVFKYADARFINLECVISDRGTPWSKTPKVFHFRTDARNIKTLQAADINAVSLANNHALDYGYDAMLDMVSILDRTGINHAGAGGDLSGAASPAFFRVGGLKVGFIAFTDNEPEWEAGVKSAGTFYVPIDVRSSQAKRLFEIVRDTKNKVDLLVVSAHWGPNWGYRPAQEHIPFAHALVDSGADVIFGHSCHVFQGIEIYKKRPILYSTGDFVDDYAVHAKERNDESFIFMVEVTLGRIRRLRLYPTVISRFQANLAEPKRAKKVAEKMQKLCSEFKTRSQWMEKEQYLEIA